MLPVASEELLETVRAMLSPVSRERSRGADEITDLARALTSSQVVLVTRLLVALRLGEDDVECQEAQLNALCELKEWRELDGETLRRLCRLPVPSLVGSQQEHYRALFASC